MGLTIFQSTKLKPSVLNANINILTSFFASAVRNGGTAPTHGVLVDLGSSELSSPTTLQYTDVSGYQKWITGDMLDNCDDSSVDGSVWNETTSTANGSVTENTSRLRARAETSGSTDSSELVETQVAVAGDVTFSLVYQLSCSNGADGGASTLAKFQLYDGNTYHDIDSETASGGGSSADSGKLFAYIRVDSAANTAYYSINGAAETSIDVTGWSAFDLRLVANAVNGNTATSSANVDVFWIMATESSSTAQQVVDATNITDQSTFIRAFQNNDLASTQNTVDISYDGTNYTSCSVDTWTTINDTGSDLKIRYNIPIVEGSAPPIFDADDLKVVVLGSD